MRLASAAEVGFALREVADEDDAAAAGVDAERMGADDAEAAAVLAVVALARRVVPRPPSLVDGAPVVDGEVVPDVGEAPADDVVAVHVPHHLRGVLRVVGAVRVVDDELADRREPPLAGGDRLVGTPLGPGDDRRRGDPRRGRGSLLGRRAGGRQGGRGQRRDGRLQPVLTELRGLERRGDRVGEGVGQQGGERHRRDPADPGPAEEGPAVDGGCGVARVVGQ